MYELLIVLSQGIYFVTRLGNTPSFGLGTLLFDGEKAESTNNTSWYKIKAIPKQIEQSIKMSGNFLHYAPCAGLGQSENFLLRGLFPSIETTGGISREVYQEQTEIIQSLFYAVYSEPTYKKEEVNFTIIQIIDLERYNAEFMQTVLEKNIPWVPYFHEALTTKHELHNFCRGRIPETHVFEYLANSILSHWKDYHKYGYSIKDFKNIGGMHISRSVKLANPYNYVVDVSKPSARKAKYQTQTKRHVDIEVITLATAEFAQKYSQHKNTCVIKGIKAENLFDAYIELLELEKKVLGIFKKESLEECPHCKGLGVQLENPTF